MPSKSSQNETERLVSRFVRHAGYTGPTPLQSAVVPLISQGRDHVIESVHGDGKRGAILMSLLVALKKTRGSDTRAIILTGSTDEVHALQQQYRRLVPRTGSYPSVTVIGRESSARKELRVLKRHSDILLGTPERVIDHLRRDNLSLAKVEYVMLDVPEDLEAQGFDKDVLFIFSKLRGKQQTFAFMRDSQEASSFESILKRPQSLLRSDWNGSRTVDSNTQEANMSDNEKAKSTVAGLIKRLKEDENPEILNHYRKLYRRNVPMHLRGYLAAMLLKDILGSDDGSHEATGARKSGGRRRGKESRQQKESHKNTGSENGSTKTLFVSIGKNRKVYPNDLSKLFTDALGIDQSQIGTIKILDSYSFIDVPADRAENAISQLNETEFRGRKITVNHARKKRR